MIGERSVAFVEFYSDDYAAFALKDVRGPNASLLVFKNEAGQNVQAVINFGKK